MTIALRQSTASQVIPIGYFVDSTDGNTEETALSIANTDIKVWKAGATSLVSKNSGGATHMSNGVYYMTLDATDTNTVGPLVLHCHVSGALVTKVECVVLEEAVYDALYAASAPGYLQPTTAGRTLDVSATGEAGIDWANIGSPTTTVNLSGTSTSTVATATATTTVNGLAAGVITATSIAADAITDAKVASDVTIASVTGAVGSVTGNVGGNVTGSVGSVVSRVTANTDQLAGQTVTAAAGVTFPTSVASPTNITAGTISTVTNLTNAPTNGDLTATMKASVTTAATAATPSVTVSDKTGFSVSGTITTLDALNTAQNVEHDATQSAIVAAKAVVDATKSVTDKLDTSLELDGAVYRFTTNALEQAPTGGGAADGSGFTAIPWNPAWDAEVQSECTDALTAYAPSTLTAAGVRSAIGLATANLDTQLGDIPTVSEFNARTIVSADYATSTVAVSIQSTVGDILADTAEIGVAGAGLTNINLPDQVMNITGNLTGNVSGSVGSVTSGVTVTTNSDKTGYSISGTLTTLDALDTAQDIQHSTTQSSLSTLTTTANNILADTAEIGVAGAGLTNINLPNQTMDIVGNITGNLSGSVGSVTNRVTANADQIAGSATAATNLSKSALGIVYGTAVTGTLSTTQMSTDLTETTNDHYIGRIIVWTSGALAGQATNITAYNGSTKVVTYTATTESPANGDTWVMV